MIEQSQELLIRQCCHEVKHLAGDVVEIGVHRGETAELICELMTNSTVYLFDTFEGMPPSMVSSIDHHTAGEFGDTSAERVKKRLSRFENAVVVTGVFPDSAAGLAPRIRFAHIDVDLYRSTKAALEWCWPLLVDGGVMLNDDYACGSCLGARKAVDEFALSYHANTEFTLHRAIIRRHL